MEDASCVPSRQVTTQALVMCSPSVQSNMCVSFLKGGAPRSLGLMEPGTAVMCKASYRL